MKKLFALVLALVMMMSLVAVASAEVSDYMGFMPGVTVVEDSMSPTGYTAVFVYDTNSVIPSNLGLKDIAAVTMYSDCMCLFTYEEQEPLNINGEFKHMPEEYTEGMFPGGGNGPTRLDVEMEYIGNNLWGCKVPLSSGAFVYNYQITDSEGNVKSRLSDPANPAAFNEQTCVSDLSSMVYVPYNSDTMNKDEWADRSVEMPKTEGAKGTYIETSYKGINGEVRGLCVYLPAGYEAEREEPYNVLYLSHGGSSDKRGNEMRWMNEGCVVNIMDNLEADFVVVTMNNGDMDGWNYDLISIDMFKYIVPFVESNFNVATDASGRAYAGLSMGGCTTTHMLANHTSEFGWYGVWSASVPEMLDAPGAKETIKALADSGDITIQIGHGDWDYGGPACQNLAGVLDEIDAAYTTLTVPGAHDWETWQLLFAYDAANFFFK